MPPLVTIGIPCFNAGAWIQKCVNSALDQTHTLREILVVDDGSSDDSVERLVKFGDRIRLYQGEHRGANHARNLILSRARGDWIQYLDADDYLLPGKVKDQLAEGGALRGLDVLYSPVRIEEWVDGRPGKGSMQPVDSGNDLFKQWLSWGLPQVGGTLWRRLSLKELGGWDEGMPCCQTEELYMRAVQRGCKFHFTPTVGAVFRQWSADTLSRRDPDLNVAVRTRLMDQMIEWMTKNGRLTDDHRRVAGRACLGMARSLSARDPERARRYHDERKQQGLIDLGGPAAPFFYRMAYRLLGFEKAERLAVRRREKKQ